MSQAHRSKSRRRQRRAGSKPAPAGSPPLTAEGSSPSPASQRPRGGRRPGTSAKTRPEKKTRQRWFYDVRQYALLTDAAGQLLLLQLPADYDTGTANTWTLPGGKLEPSDEPLSGISREILEETGLQPDALAAAPLPVAVARWSSRNSKKLAIFYRVQVAGTAPKAALSHEHQRAVWATPAELKNFPFHRPEMLETVLSVLGRGLPVSAL